MAHKAPGKSFRKGLSIIEITTMFPGDATAEVWFKSHRWPDGPYCPRCGSFNVQCNIKHTSMTHRCRDCPKKPMFSLKHGTIMEGSKLGYQVWAIGIYFLQTNLKSVSSMKLSRDLSITQKTAWHLAHRIRKSFETKIPVFCGPTEVDETYVGGKEKNKHTNKKLRAGRGAVGKTAVIGAKDRKTNKVVARVVKKTDAATLKDFVASTTARQSVVYTDDAKAYKGMADRTHEVVCHSIGEYVNGMAHTNGVESFWSMLKRGYHGTFHHFSEQHMVGMRLRYQDLIR